MPQPSNTNQGNTVERRLPIKAIPTPGIALN
jgi:hypothetical protein